MGYSTIKYQQGVWVFSRGLNRFMVKTNLNLGIFAHFSEFQRGYCPLGDDNRQFPAMIALQY